MPKPTLLQSLLNKPSQSYTQPSSTPRRSLSLPSSYHTVRNEMHKAAQASGSIPPSSSVRLHHNFTPHECNPLIAQVPPVVSELPPTPPTPPSDDQDSDQSSGDNDVFYTPNTSPRSTLYGELISEEHHSSISQKLEQIASSDVTRSEVPWLSHNRSPSASVASFSTASSTLAISSDNNSHFTLPTSRASTSTGVTSPLSFNYDDFDDCIAHTVPPKEEPVRIVTTPRSVARKRNFKIDSEEWAKDVRWLVPSTDLHKSPPLRSTRKSAPKRPEPTMIQSITSYSVPATTQISQPHRRSKTVGSRSSSRRTLEKRRMSAVWEEDEGDDGPARERDYQQTRALLDVSGAQARVRSTPPRSRASSMRSGKTREMATSSTKQSARVVDLPVTLMVTDGGSPQGYTSLVLPRAAYTPSSNKRYTVLFGNDDSVDITRSGLAQTTMSTISITKNGATAGLTSRPRFLSLSSLHLSKHGAASKSMPDHLLSTLPPPLSLTSHTSPPTKVHSTQILVQVYAVGLDSLDDVIVHDKVSSSDGYGFVPGRSFVGRAVECGYEVNCIAKSDWVMGLLDVRKCGALSEFIIVEKRRLTQCARPSPHLTLEQLALLPLCGIPSHRAVRTSEHIERGARALVLQGHDGAGALAVQELAANGVHVTVQIPPDIHPEKEKNAEALRKIEDRVRKWGAREVRVDYPVAAVNMMHENELDLIIDTVGGRKIWDACRRVLHTTGQFTTLVGDSSSTVPTKNAQIRSNLRSLHRAFVKMDRKSIGYAWVSPVADVDNDGEDVRDSLGAVAKLAGEGVLVPWVDAARCVPFERAPTLFGKEKSLLGCGRTAVVRIVN